MTIRTSQGNRVETLETSGHSTPFRHNDYIVLRVAVDGHPCPPWQIPAETWEYEAATMNEPDFWQNVADAALSMRDVQTAGQLQI